MQRRMPGIQALAAALEAPPDGFRPLMVQHVARHGSRGLSSPDDEDLLYQLWKYARDRGQLTELGQQLGPERETMIAVHARLGFGRLSRLGEMEHEQQAQRLVARLYPAPMTDAAYEGVMRALLTPDLIEALYGL